MLIIGDRDEITRELFNQNTAQVLNQASIQSGKKDSKSSKTKKNSKTK